MWSSFFCAVKLNGLIFASLYLRRNKGIVLAAVKQNVFALRLASRTLRNYVDIVLTTVFFKIGFKVLECT